MFKPLKHTLASVEGRQQILVLYFKTELLYLVDLKPASYAICMITVTAGQSYHLLPAFICCFADHTSAGKVQCSYVSVSNFNKSKRMSKFREIELCGYVLLIILFPGEEGALVPKWLQIRYQLIR